MFFRRRAVAPTPDVMRRLAHNGDANAMPPDKFLVESTKLLESLQGAIDICFARAMRQLEVLSFAGQRPDALELWRTELAALQELISDIADIDPPFSPVEVGRHLRAFAAGEDT